MKVRKSVDHGHEPEDWFARAPLDDHDSPWQCVPCTQWTVSRVH